MGSTNRPERRRIALIASVILSLAASATAQTDPEQRPSLENERFDIDLVVGPVLGAGRIIGLSGAYSAIAQGIAGARINPAAYANRQLWDLDWFQWDVSFDLVPASVRNSDFDNNGESGFAYDDFLFLTLGGGLRFGGVGLGLAVDVQSYRVGSDTDLSLTQWHWGGGYAFADGQLVVGGGGRTIALSITDLPSGETLVDFGGTAPEMGAVLRLEGQPFSVGAAVRLPVQSEQASVPIAAGFTLPEHVRLPWEAQAGIAWQLGPRPLHRNFRNPHDDEAELHEQARGRSRARIAAQAEREALSRKLALAQTSAPPDLTALGDEEDAPHDPEFWHAEAQRQLADERSIEAELAARAAERAQEVRGLSRRYVLLVAEVYLIGPTHDGVGLESFLLQERQASGKHVSVGARFGVEGEALERYVKMRAGSYLEPSRFEGVTHRAHATLGTEVRLFSWDLFGLIDEFTLRAGAFADVAERYLSVGGGLGLWQ